MYTKQVRLDNLNLSFLHLTVNFIEYSSLLSRGHLSIISEKMRVYLSIFSVRIAFIFMAESINQIVVSQFFKLI